jgi:hypothetical protein
LSEPPLQSSYISCEFIDARMSLLDLASWASCAQKRLGPISPTCMLRSVESTLKIVTSSSSATRCLFSLLG